MISLVFMPLGYVVAGPAAEAFGLDRTLVVAALVGITVNLGVLLVPDVRNLRRVEEPAFPHERTAAIPLASPQELG
jgi:hypothetical protein